MTDRMQVFDKSELGIIHDASMEVLGKTGVRFNSSEAVDLFRRHGFRTDGVNVFFTETQVYAALKTAPSRFMIRAANPEKNVWVGEDDFVLLPTGGAPNVSAFDGRQRPATLADYHVCCQLVQTSDQLDMNGGLMVQPMDLPPKTAHLDLLLANMLMCDKAYTGLTIFRQASLDCLEMAAIAWGGRENLKQQPVMAAIINAASPLKYQSDEADALIDMARHGQAVVVTDLVMGGTSGPVSLPGLLALVNAEILAGIVLTQIAGPGTPVVYGSVSAPADMRTVTSAVGAPEAVVLASAVIQLAQYYKLPCRTGGMITNSHCMDAQAAAEGTLMMTTALRNGANFIFHACGQLGSYISMSFEKWLIDEEMCRTLRRVLTSMQVTVETIDVDTIMAVGNHGNYLLHPTTFKHCRSLYQPDIFTRSDYTQWFNKGAKRADERAAEKLEARLAKYVKPAVDERLERELAEFVRRRKVEIG